jgi:3-oxoacyl-[acyl-carrier-protein] synthase-1/3-oxoacyl-[acyl-carrier-protein] synthase II
MDDFLCLTGYRRPVIDYRKHLGEFASASAVAAVLGVSFVQTGEIQGGVFRQERISLQGCGVLVMGFGKFITAVEILP